MADASKVPESKGLLMSLIACFGCVEADLYFRRPGLIVLPVPMVLWFVATARVRRITRLGHSAAG